MYVNKFFVNWLIFFFRGTYKTALKYGILKDGVRTSFCKDSYDEFDKHVVHQHNMIHDYFQDGSMDTIGTISPFN